VLGEYNNTIQYVQYTLTLCTAIYVTAVQNDGKNKYDIKYKSIGLSWREDGNSLQNLSLKGLSSELDLAFDNMYC
jgi:hypothetical protein